MTVLEPAKDLIAGQGSLTFPGIQPCLTARFESDNLDELIEALRVELHIEWGKLAREKALTSTGKTVVSLQLVFPTGVKDTGVMTFVGPIEAPATLAIEQAINKLRLAIIQSPIPWADKSSSSRTAFWQNILQS